MLGNIGSWIGSFTCRPLPEATDIPGSQSLALCGRRVWCAARQIRKLQQQDIFTEMSQLLLPHRRISLPHRPSPIPPSPIPIPPSPMNFLVVSSVLHKARSSRWDSLRLGQLGAKAEAVIPDISSWGQWLVDEFSKNKRGNIWKDGDPT